MRRQTCCCLIYSLMPSLDAPLEAVVTALVRGLRTLDVSFCLVGALVPELLLATKPDTRTNDADAVVLVPDIAAFGAVKTGLRAVGFDETRLSHRLTYRKGGLIDLLPYGEQLVRDGKLRLPPDLVLNMAGLDRVVGAAVDVTLDSGLVVPVAPLSLYALLKLVAYTDRRAQKDLDSVEHVLRCYAADDDRRWGLEHESTLVEYDYSPAYLLGSDGAVFMSPQLVAVIEPLLDALSAEETASAADDDWTPPREQLFRWYRRGLGL